MLLVDHAERLADSFTDQTTLRPKEVWHKKNLLLSIQS
jgi:hypothetical protein